jgi:uncharacterized membrane protein
MFNDHAAWGHPMHHGFHWGILLLLICLVALVVISFLVLRALGSAPKLRGRTAPTSADDAAVELLRQRLARGEISVEDFRARLEALEMTGLGVHPS